MEICEALRHRFLEIRSDDIGYVYMGQVICAGWEGDVLVVTFGCLLVYDSDDETWKGVKVRTQRTCVCVASGLSIRIVRGFVSAGASSLFVFSAPRCQSSKRALSFASIASALKSPTATKIRWFGTKSRL